MKLQHFSIAPYAVAAALFCAASSTVFAQGVTPAPATQVQRDRVHQHINGNAARHDAALAQRDQLKANSEMVGHGKLLRQAAARKDHQAAANRRMARNNDHRAANQRAAAREHAATGNMRAASRNRANAHRFERQANQHRLQARVNEHQAAKDRQQARKREDR